MQLLVDVQCAWCADCVFLQVWTELIQHMKEQKLLPSINFMFSKRMIDNTAALLSHIDLCTNAEKGRIGAFMTRCVLAASLTKHGPEPCATCGKHFLVATLTAG